MTAGDTCDGHGETMNRIRTRRTLPVSGTGLLLGRSCQLSRLVVLGDTNTVRMSIIVLLVLQYVKGPQILPDLWRPTMHILSSLYLFHKPCEHRLRTVLPEMANYRLSLEVTWIVCTFLRLPRKHQKQVGLGSSARSLCKSILMLRICVRLHFSASLRVLHENVLISLWGYS